jgi:anti-sigma-K factor RskA
MNTDDMHVLAAAYTLDAIEPEERREFESHLDSCAQCRQEVSEFAETVGVLGAAAAELPPPGMRTAVFERIAHTRQAPPRVVVPEHVAFVTRLRHSAAALTAAAAALVAVAAGGYAWHEHQTYDSYRSTQAQVTTILAASDAHTEHVAAKGGGKMTVVRSASARKAVVIPSHMPSLTAGRVYQLWVVADGVPLPRTVLSGKPQIIDDVRSNDVIGVTVEAHPGATKPTLPMIINGA